MLATPIPAFVCSDDGFPDSCCSGRFTFVVAETRYHEIM